MHAAAKKTSDLEALAARILAVTRTEALRDHPDLRTNLVEGARGLADRGELEVAMLVLRVATLNTLQAQATRTLRRKLQRVVGR